MRRWHLYRSLQVIQSGGILAYPTEAVFGLGCSPFSEIAVRRILRLKNRSISKGLILVGSDIAQFSKLVDFEALKQVDAILSTWPGPVTWVLPVKPAVPYWLTGRKRGLAIRISAHPLVRELCRQAGPLVSTSANPAGCEPARDAGRVRTYFGNALDYILPGAVGHLSAPTEIRDAFTGQILRSGG